jgi:hypothetical protein
MLKNELAIIKKIRFGSTSPQQLEEIYNSFGSNYRIKLHLVQAPQFPVRDSLSIVSELFSADLVRVIKNPKTNPFIRKKAENEFILRYPKIPLGEKYSFLIQLPESLLKQLTFEKSGSCIRRILQNPKCTEVVIVNFITLSPEKKEFYQELEVSKWLKRKLVVNAILEDSQAPVKILLAVIPLLTSIEISRLYDDPKIHESVKKNIAFIRARKDKNGGYS